MVTVAALVSLAIVLVVGAAAVAVLRGRFRLPASSEKPVVFELMKKAKAETPDSKRA